MRIIQAVYGLETTLGIKHVSNKSIMKDFTRGCLEQQVLTCNSKKDEYTVF